MSNDDPFSAEDEKFLAAHPNLRNPKQLEKYGRAAVEVMKAHGLTDDAIRHGYYESGELRTAEAQHAMYVAGRAHLEPTAKNTAALVALRRKWQKGGRE
jgi:hypothetical protein